MKRKSTLFLAILGLASLQQAFSQTGYRSIASGGWADFANTWERTGNIYNPTPTWIAPTGAPTSNQIVVVRNGHSVTTDGTKSCLNLIIEAGGRLSAAGAANTLRVGVPSSGNAGSIDTLTVDGILGGAGELIPLELGAGAASLWIRGTGTIEIGRIRPANSNLNYAGSAAANAASGARLLIDKDIRLNTAGNYVLSALNSTPTVNDSVSVTIFQGRTVTVVNSSSYFHNDVATAAAGKYAYNINGTLDLSANPSTTGGTKFTPYGNAASSITLNVNGVLKLGGYFKADTVAASLGSLFLNIGNGGLVDGTLTSKMITGTIGAASATPNIFWVVSGSGALRRTVPADGTKVEFAIGTSTTTYNPVVISSAAGVGSDEVFTVSVKNSLTNPFNSTTFRALNKEWNITESTPGGNDDTLRLAWTTADETAAGYTHNPSDVVSIIHWTGSTWDTSMTASVTGTGTLADPYVAKSRAGFTSFSPFSIAFKTSGTTPVRFVNVRGTQKVNGVQVEFSNATETDVVSYSIEKSANGINFTSVGTLLAATNNGGLNSYTFLDAAAIRGVNFYRVKSVERDGRVNYSFVVKVNTGGGKQAVNVYPNPVRNSQLSVQLDDMQKNTYNITLINNIGQQVFTKQVNHQGGSATMVIDLPASAAKGLYNLQVTGGEFRTVKNIVIE